MSAFFFTASSRPRLCRRLRRRLGGGGKAGQSLGQSHQLLSENQLTDPSPFDLNRTISSHRSTALLGVPLAIRSANECGYTCITIKVELLSGEHDQTHGLLSRFMSHMSHRYPTLIESFP